MAGRIDRAVQDPADGGGAVVADLADPKDGVDAEVVFRLFRIQFAQFKHVGAVDEDDDFIELALDVFDQFDLRIVQLQYVF